MLLSFSSFSQTFVIIWSHTGNLTYVLATFALEFFWVKYVRLRLKLLRVRVRIRYDAGYKLEVSFENHPQSALSFLSQCSWLGSGKLSLALVHLRASVVPDLVKAVSERHLDRKLVAKFDPVFLTPLSVKGNAPGSERERNRSRWLRNDLSFYPNSLS